MRIIAVIIVLTIFAGSCQQENDWKKQYINQEKTKVTTVEKTMEYHSGIYHPMSLDTTFETFNEKGQKIRDNQGLFYDYDSNGNLKSVKYSAHKKTELGEKGAYVIVTSNYHYDNKGLLTKIVFSDNVSSDEFSYDELGRQKTKIRKLYDEIEDSWTVYPDTMYYEDSSNNISVTHSYLNPKVLTVYEYNYNDDNTIKSRINKTFATGTENDIDSSTIFNYLYCRIDYKYNSSKQLIEETWSRPDYKTPYYKMTYEYLETQIE